MVRVLLTIAGCVYQVADGIRRAHQGASAISCCIDRCCAAFKFAHSYDSAGERRSCIPCHASISKFAWQHGQHDDLAVHVTWHLSTERELLHMQERHLFLNSGWGLPHFGLILEPF